MPLDLIPDSAPYPRSLLGWDGIDYRVISVDLEGRVIPSVVPTLYNYDEQYREQVFDLNPGVVDFVLYGTPCPAGHVYKVTNLYAYDVDTNITSITFGTRLAADHLEIHTCACAVVRDPVMWDGEIWVDPGYMIYALFTGSAVGDDLYLNIHGHLMLSTW